MKRSSRRATVKAERAKTELGKMGIAAEFRVMGEPLDSEAFVLAAAGTEGGDAKSFEMLAYTGGKIDVGFEAPVVVDLAGLRMPRGQLPIYAYHDSRYYIGHVEAKGVQKTDTALRMSGRITNTESQTAKEIIAMSRNGSQWQASIGASVEKAVMLKAEKTANVNGQEIEGPAVIVRKSRLCETSFVPLGADSNTRVNVAAGHREIFCSENEEFKMKFDEWLAAEYGMNADDLTAEQAEKFTAKFNAPEAETEEVSDSYKGLKAENDADEIRGEVESIKAELAEAARISAIRTACGDNVELADKAVKAGWTAAQTEEVAGEVNAVRASRPQAFAIGASTEVDGDVLAAAALSGTIRSETREKAFSEKTLDAADRLGSITGVSDLFIRAAAIEGMTLPHKRDNDYIRAALSVTGLSGILGNVANKSMLDGYDMVENAWREVAAIASVNDFKTHTRYRLTSDMEYEKVGAGGEFAHGSIDELSYTQRADTYGIMYSLTRQMIINDDLGALNSMARQLGIGSADAVNKAFWTTFLDNSTFFASGNSNVGTGALSIANLTTGVATFKKQVKPSGHPLGWVPSVLLVPVDLEVIADQLFSDLSVNESATAGAPALSGNPHRGKYRPVSSAYMSNDSYTGYSATAWYLLADPMRAATVEVAFLNGVQTPTVESADADFNTLGVQFRGYHDFGISMQDYRAGFKSTGE